MERAVDNFETIQPIIMSFSPFESNYPCGHLLCRNMCDASLFPLIYTYIPICSKCTFYVYLHKMYTFLVTLTLKIK